VMHGTLICSIRFFLAFSSAHGEAGAIRTYYFVALYIIVFKTIYIYNSFIMGRLGLVEAETMERGWSEKAKTERMQCR